MYPTKQYPYPSLIRPNKYQVHVSITFLFLTICIRFEIRLKYIMIGYRMTRAYFHLKVRTTHFKSFDSWLENLSNVDISKPFFCKLDHGINIYYILVFFTYFIISPLVGFKMYSI